MTQEEKLKRLDDLRDRLNRPAQTQQQISRLWFCLQQLVDLLWDEELSK